MRLAKLIQARLRRSVAGVNVDSDVNAVVAANVGERGSVTRVSSTRRSTAGAKTAERDEAK